MGGVKHFGYYPDGQESLPTVKAQELMNEQLAKNLGMPAGSVILDAGCGEGGVALYLARNYQLNITGIDLLDFNISNAKASCIKLELTDLVSFKLADYSKTGFPSSSFDAIYTMETLVHSPNYQETVSEFHRLLKPGGKLVLFEYSMAPDGDITTDAKQAFNKVNQLSSMPAFDEFSYGVLGDTLQKNGFIDVETQDITLRMLPLLEKFSKKAKYPYKLVSLIGLQNHFVNAMSAIVFWKYRDWFQYNIVTGTRDK